MRAAEQAHPSHRHPTTRAHLAHVVMAVLITIVLLWIWHPAVLHAQRVTAASAATAASKAAAAASAHATAGTSSEQDTSKKTVRPAPASPAAQPARSTGKASTAARDTATTTHVVKSGETLWGIASRYYGDGHQWRALAGRNGIPTSSDTALRVGRKLIVPARRTMMAAGSDKPPVNDSTVPRVATTPATVAPAPQNLPGTEALTVAPKRVGALASQTTGKADGAGAKAAAAAPTLPPSAAAMADTTAIAARGLMKPQVKAERLMTRGPQRIGLADASAARAARTSSEQTTIFVRTAPDEDEARAAARAILGRAVIAPRRGEYNAAPFPITEAKLASAGRLGRRTDAPGAVAQYDSRPQLRDEVEVSAPVGVTLAVGDRLVVIEDGGVLADGQHVAVPTGILQVTSVDAGKSPRAFVRSAIGAMEQGAALVMAEGEAVAGDLRPDRSGTSDVETTVSWTHAGEMLPTLQSYLLLRAGQAQGVKAGDEFALVRARPSGGEDRVAVVRIVRSGAGGSSAVVIGQSLPEIATGLTARRIARAP